MFGSIQKAVAVAAIVAAGAFAPAAASAGAWDDIGPAHLQGQLTMTFPGSGITTTCDVTSTLDLSNPGGVASGQLTIALFGANIPAGGTCTTNLPNCTIDKTALTATPWNITTSGFNVTLSGVSLTTAFTGPLCALTGVSVPATGSITGVNSGNVITFTNAGPLTTPLGPLTVTGSVELYAEDENGGPDYNVPIGLVF